LRVLAIHYPQKTSDFSHFDVKKTKLWTDDLKKVRSQPKKEQHLSSEQVDELDKNYIRIYFPGWVTVR